MVMAAATTGADSRRPEGSMSEVLGKSLTSKDRKLKMDVAAVRSTETFLLIENEYIKNLQKQVYLLELETSYLRKQAKEATRDQPKQTAKAEQTLVELKELQSQISGLKLATALQERRISAGSKELEDRHRHLHSVSENNEREKSLLVEDVTQLKRLADVSTQDVSHKEEEHRGILQELHSTIQRVKEGERDLRLLQTQLQEQIKQHESVDLQLSEKRTECLKAQATIHQMEEEFMATAQSVQERIVCQLRQEAEKLRTQLKEKQLAADEDTYLRNKLAEDSGRLTKENAQLRTRILETSKHLEEEKQLRESESLQRTKRISELALGKEKERHLELQLSHWKRLVQEETGKVTAAQRQVLELQQDRKSAEKAGSSLHARMTDLHAQHARIQQENSLLRVEKNHLVEHISQLHKQMADKNDEIRRMHSHVDSLCQDFNSLKLRTDPGESSDKLPWQRLPSIPRHTLQDSTWISLA